MSKDKKDQLRDLLSRQLQAASDEAVRSGGQISAEQMDGLGRLAQLVALYQTAFPAPARKRWPVALALVSTLLFVSLLLFVRVAETEVELDLKLSEVSFSLPAQQVLAQGMNPSSLGVSGLREAGIPQDRRRKSQILRAPDDRDMAMRVSVLQGSQRESSITLAPLLLPQGARVRVQHSGLPRQYRLSLEGADAVLQVDVSGQVRVEGRGIGVEQLDFPAPDALRLQPGSGEINLELAFPEMALQPFSPMLRATNLSFLRIDQYLENNRTLIRDASTILSGTLYLVSLTDQERNLRSGEAIRLEHAEGEIRTLRLQDDHIEMNFHGRVRGMTTGSEESSRSLMPTWLEWLNARHSLSLFWGAALYLFGLVTVVFRWWGRSGND
jgi:hypothetical protein